MSELIELYNAIRINYGKNSKYYKTMKGILDVLDYFNIPEPEFLNDVKLKIEDISYYKECFVSEKASIKKWRFKNCFLKKILLLMLWNWCSMLFQNIKQKELFLFKLKLMIIYQTCYRCL